MQPSPVTIDVPNGIGSKVLLVADALGGTLHTQTIYNPDGQVWKTIDARGNWSETD
jgi:hypothetical protein